MTLTELRYIVTLAREQHFGRAAGICNVSQPTLSIAVKKLEEELGVALFERTKLKVITTPLGEQIINKARSVLEQTADIKDIADTGRDQLNSPLAVGALDTIGPYLMPQFIPLLQELAKRMPLYVEEGDAETLARKLRGGELDAIIVSLPFSEPDVVTQPLFDEPFAVLMPENHRLATHEKIKPEDLHSGEVLLLQEGHCFRDQVLAALPHLDHAEQPSTRQFFQGSTLEALRLMVASGLGVTVLPMSAEQNSLYAPGLLTTRPFIEPTPKRTLALAWRASFPRHKAIDALRTAIHACSASYWNYSSERGTERPGLLVENRDW